MRRKRAYCNWSLNEEWIWKLLIDDRCCFCSFLFYSLFTYFPIAYHRQLRRWFTNGSLLVMKPHSEKGEKQNPITNDSMAYSDCRTRFIREYLVWVYIPYCACLRVIIGLLFSVRHEPSRETILTIPSSPGNIHTFPYGSDISRYVSHVAEILQQF